MGVAGGAQGYISTSSLMMSYISMYTAARFISPCVYGCRFNLKFQARRRRVGDGNLNLESGASSIIIDMSNIINILRYSS